ncbi:MAG: helix-turn-helix domain-containing protein [Clostridium perfringens]|nr:helix-turn-helix domain-containing protein [Clostridium perfringens]
MKIYSIEEVSKILKTNKQTVYALVNKKMLVALKLKSLKVPEYAIEEFFRKYQFMDLSDLDNVKEMMVQS